MIVLIQYGIVSNITLEKHLEGLSAELATPAPNGSVRVTVTTKEKHRLRRDDKVRILNAAEDIYNNEHDVVGIINEFTFEFILSSAPSTQYYQQILSFSSLESLHLVQVSIHLSIIEFLIYC